MMNLEMKVLRMIGNDQVALSLMMFVMNHYVPVQYEHQFWIDHETEYNLVVLLLMMDISSKLKVIWNTNGSYLLLNRHPMVVCINTITDCVLVEGNPGYDA